MRMVVAAAMSVAMVVGVHLFDISLHLFVHVLKDAVIVVVIGLPIDIPFKQFASSILPSFSRRLSG